MKTAPLLFVLAVLTAAIDTGYGYVPSPEDVKGVGSLGKGLVKGDDITQYGNWYGPGWWGGDRKATAGGKPPVDEMDAAAQRHDFGYQEAERMGKIYGKAEERIPPSGIRRPRIRKKRAGIATAWSPGSRMSRMCMTRRPKSAWARTG
jgi:hypothetical protein